MDDAPLPRFIFTAWHQVCFIVSRSDLALAGCAVNDNTRYRILRRGVT